MDKLIKLHQWTGIASASSVRSLLAQRWIQIKAATQKSKLKPSDVDLSPDDWVDKQLHLYGDKSIYQKDEDEETSHLYRDVFIGETPNDMDERLLVDEAGTVDGYEYIDKEVATMIREIKAKNLKTEQYVFMREIQLALDVHHKLKKNTIEDNGTSL